MNYKYLLYSYLCNQCGPLLRSQNCHKGMVWLREPIWQPSAEELGRLQLDLLDDPFLGVWQAA